MTRQNAELDALVARLEAAGLIETFDEDGRQVIRLTPDGARVARQMAMSDDRTRCSRRCSPSSIGLEEATDGPRWTRPTQERLGIPRQGDGTARGGYGVEVFELDDWVCAYGGLKTLESFDRYRGRPNDGRS